MYQKRFQGTLRHIYAHWPFYFGLYFGIIAALSLVGLSALRGWITAGMAASLIGLMLAGWLLASLWGAHLSLDRGGLRPHLVLYEMAGLAREGRTVYIDLGFRTRALELADELTTGKLTVVDIYNPQLAPSRAVHRYRRRAPSMGRDPRLEWLSGSIDLLPLPDSSAATVILCQLLSELWQQGDQEALLREVRRILAPDGFLLVCEAARTRFSPLAAGPKALGIRPADHWRSLFSRAGFRLRNERELAGLLRCFQIGSGKQRRDGQLAFDLELPKN